jgi:hypothetical protein
LFIADPDPDFFTHPGDPGGSKKAPVPGSATLLPKTVDIIDEGALEKGNRKRGSTKGSDPIQKGTGSRIRNAAQKLLIL